jgi:uncharacterized protein YecT (DUF1311 family)
MPFRSSVLDVLALFLAIAPASAVPVATKTIRDKAPTYDITVAYPQTGLKPIDDDIAAWAGSTAANFRAEAKSDHQPGEQPYELDVSFGVPRNDASVFAVLFEEYTDTDGAHPNHDYYTANYLMPDGWRVYLPELFDGTKSLARISALAITDLDRRIATGPDAMSDSDTVKMGADAFWDNFADFVLMPKALVIHFPPYQVAAYAAGPQESTISLLSLRDVMRADPRLPMASFDCAQARTTTERALCSDVALARLDRQLAENFSRHLRAATGAAAKNGLRNEQRDWLARRDGACAGQSAGARTACLTGLYKERLAWFSRQS